MSVKVISNNDVIYGQSGIFEILLSLLIYFSESMIGMISVQAITA